MRRLAESVRHTEAYLKFLDESRLKTLERIGNDSALVAQLYGYWWRPNDDRKKALCEVHRHHANGSQSTGYRGIRRTDFEFFNQPRRFYPELGKNSILYGFFHGNISSGKRKISINTHPDSLFNDRLGVLTPPIMKPFMTKQCSLPGF